MALIFFHFGFFPAKNRLRNSKSVSQKKVHCILCTPLTKIFARAAKTGCRSSGFHDKEFA